MTSIDWTKPIEAVHEDGRVLGVALATKKDTSTPNPDSDGDFYTLPSLGNGRFMGIWHSDGSRWFPESGVDKGWRIRNVQPTTPTSERPSDEVVERMVAFVNKCAEHGFPDAQAIAALLPQPVDPDLIAAREMSCTDLAFTDGMSFQGVRYSVCEAVKLISSGEADDHIGVKGRLRAIKHGREQERKA